MVLRQPPLHIIGAGSIGLLWAASIRSKFPNYPLTVLLRDTRRRREPLRIQQPPTLGSGGEGGGGVEHVQGDRCRPEMVILMERRYQLQACQPPSHRSVTDDDAMSRVSVPVEFIDQDAADAGPIRNLIVATKSYQAAAAVQSVLPRMTSTNTTESKNDDTSKIIVLCNGALSVRDELQTLLNESCLPQQQHQSYVSLVLATTTHGAYREDTEGASLQAPDGRACQLPTTIPTRRLVHAGYGRTFIADDRQPAGADGDGDDEGYGRRTADLWNEAGLNCAVLSPHEMDSLLWKKLAANCVINPITALHRCTNGELLLEPSFPRMLKDVLREVASVMAGLAQHDSHTGEGGSSQASLVSGAALSEATLREFVMQVIRDTRDNKSSMYQDVVRGQKTEIEHLNGYIVRKGSELGLECPVNEDVRQRVRELEASSSSASPAAPSPGWDSK